jgi:hypothetical protein
VCEGIQDAIAVLVYHSKQIQEKIFYRAIPSTVFNAQKERMNTLSSTIDTLISGKKGHDYKKFVCTFLNYREEFSVSLYGTYILSDTLSIQFLSNLLRCDDEEIVSLAGQYLYRETGFDVLKSQSTYIKRNIRQSPLPYYCTTLLSLLNLTKEEKDSLLRIKLPLNVKANIGDTTALDSMVALYRKETDPSSKGRLIESIMSTGQQRGVKVIMADLVKPLYEIAWQNSTRPCTTDVLHRMVVKGLPRYFPHDTLFIKEFPRLSEMTNNGSQKINSIVVRLWSALEVWVWKHYKISIGKTPPYRGVFLSCSRPKY